jgi:hypothetical protein
MLQTCNFELEVIDEDLTIAKSRIFSRWVLRRAVLKYTFLDSFLFLMGDRDFTFVLDFKLF